jgi:site-specific recombinase XerD
MATLMARVKVSANGDEPEFIQIPVEYGKNHRLTKVVVGSTIEIGKDEARRKVRVLAATSYFVRTRKKDIAQIARKSGGQASYKDFDTAVTELNRVNILEQSPLSDLPAPSVALPVVSTTDAGTWASLQNEYLDYIQLKVKRRLMAKSTENRYQGTLRNFDEFLVARGITLLADINRKLVNDFKKHRVDAMMGHGCTGNGVVAEIKNLNPVFEYAIKHEMMGKNPVEYENPKNDAERGAQPFTRAELKTMQKDEVLGDDKLVFWLLYQTGLRKSDAVDLRWSEVNGHITRIAMKNKTKVRIPIQPELKILLDAERALRNPKPEDSVLLNPETRQAYPVVGNHLYALLKRLGKRAGVADVHPHRFRDSFAYDAYYRGLSAEQVAAYLGDDLKTVRKHYSFFGEELQDQADEKLLGGKGLLETADASV